jgi:hypothetical protein
LHDGLGWHDDTGKVMRVDIICRSNVLQLESVVAPASECHVSIRCDDETTSVQKNTFEVVTRLFF